MQSFDDKKITLRIMDKVSQALKAHIGKNLPERYALYMLRVQMHELGLKNDLAE